MDKVIDGQCRHGVYQKTNGPCFRCGFCSIDGNDYSDLRNGTPHLTDY